MDTLKSEIAAQAARLVVEEGLEYGPAKRRAVKQLGLPQRSELPGNEEVEEAVREYIAIFCADTQPGELRALRELALVWMKRMADFRPYLGGAVWRGTATRLNNVHLQLFCDDAKSAEIGFTMGTTDTTPANQPDPEAERKRLIEAAPKTTSQSPFQLPWVMGKKDMAEAVEAMVLEETAHVVAQYWSATGRPAAAASPRSSRAPRGRSISASPRGVTMLGCDETGRSGRLAATDS